MIDQLLVIEDPTVFRNTSTVNCLDPRTPGCPFPRDAASVEHNAGPDEPRRMRRKSCEDLRREDSGRDNAVEMNEYADECVQ